MTVVDKEKLTELQNKITDSMMGVFETVKQGKDEEYRKKAKVDIPEDVDRLITNCGNVNAAISGGAGLLPGPWGMAAAVPEIALIIKNQVEMIYDIGKAMGKDGSVLTTELLLGIFASASGSVGIGLITVHGGKILVKRASLRVLQKVITLLGGKVTQKLLKSMVAKWLPGVGAVAMAAWSKISTNMVGKRAVEVMSREIVVEEEELVLSGEFEDVPDDDSGDELIRNKIALLSNLMKADGVISPEETDHITAIIENSDISDELTFELLAMLKDPEKAEVDYEIIKEHDEALAVMIDMAALSLADGELHPFEKVYIRQAGKSLGLADDVVEGLLEA